MRKQNQETVCRGWLFKALLSKNFLQIFQIFEEDDTPIKTLIQDNETLTKFAKSMKEYKAKKLEIKRANEEAYKKLEDDYEALIAEKDKQIIKEERKEDEWRGYCHCICPCMFKKTENDIRKKIAKNIIIKEEIEVIMDMRKQLKKDIKSPNLSE